MQHEEQVKQEVETEDQQSIMSIKEMLDVTTVDKEEGSYSVLAVPNEASELEQPAMPSLTTYQEKFNSCSKICGRPKYSSKFLPSKAKKKCDTKAENLQPNP